MPRRSFVSFAAIVSVAFAACAPHGPVTFRPLSATESKTLERYVSQEATAIAEIRTWRNGTLLLSRRRCDRFDQTICAFDVARIGEPNLDLGSITGKRIVVDGLDSGGSPVLVVDGDRCLLLPASHPGAFAYENDRYFEAIPRAQPLPPISHATAASRDAVVRGDLRARDRTSGYYAAPLPIFERRAATLVAGEGLRPNLAVFSGSPNALGALLLEQHGSLAIAATRSNGASDLVVRRITDIPLLFRYDGTRYEPAPCQDRTALDPTGVKI